MKETLSPQNPRPLILWSFVAVGILAISCASILIRLADAPAITTATYRVALASLAISPYFVYRQREKKIPWTSRIFGLTFLAGSFLALHFVFWIHSLQLTTVASSVTLVSTTPLFVALFSLLWIGERPGRLLRLGIGFTMVGSALITETDFSLSEATLRGDALAILGAVMAAGYLLAGRSVRQSLDLTSYAFSVYTMAALILLVCCFLTGSPLTGFSKETYLILLFLGLVPQLIGHTTFNWALKYLPATVVAVLILGEPVGATLLAYLFLEETVSGMKSVGLVILGAGIVVSSLAIPTAGTANRRQENVNLSSFE